MQTITITTDRVVAELEDISAVMSGPLFRPDDRKVGALLLTSALAIVNGHESTAITDMLARQGVDPVTTSRFANAVAQLAQAAGVMFREVRS